MSQIHVKRKSVVLASTALLGAIVVVLDWVLRVKIPFPIPPLVYLRFDFMGIPILLAYYIFGLPAGLVTSLVAFLSISFRDSFKGLMKFLAEFATIVGVYLVLRAHNPSKNKSRLIAIISGIIVRVTLMDLAVVLLFPIVGYYPTHIAVIVILPLLSLFNIIQGFISIFGGFILYEAVIRRLPFLK